MSQLTVERPTPPAARPPDPLATAPLVGRRRPLRWLQAALAAWRAMRRRAADLAAELPGVADQVSAFGEAAGLDLRAHDPTTKIHVCLRNHRFLRGRAMTAGQPHPCVRHRAAGQAGDAADLCFRVLDGAGKLTVCGDIDDGGSVCCIAHGSLVRR